MFKNSHPFSASFSSHTGLAILKSVLKPFSSESSGFLLPQVVCPHPVFEIEDVKYGNAILLP